MDSLPMILEMHQVVAEGLVFLCAFLDALLIEGVRNGRRGVKLPRFGEASSTYGHDVLENKSRGVKVSSRKGGRSEGVQEGRGQERRRTRARGRVST